MFAKPSDEPRPKQREACDAIIEHLRKQRGCIAALIGHRQSGKSSTAWFLSDRIFETFGRRYAVKHIQHLPDTEYHDDLDAVKKADTILCIDVIQPRTDDPAFQRDLADRVSSLDLVYPVILVMFLNQFATPLEYIDVTIEGFVRPEPVLWPSGCINVPEH
jgi:hypothetical protein